VVSEPNEPGVETHSTLVDTQAELVPDPVPESVEEAAPRRRGRPPKKEPINRYYPDLSATDGVFFTMVSALYEHYTEPENENPTIQMELSRIQRNFMDGNRGIAWKKAIGILEGCIGINILNVNQ
jgi:hypothetical protein